MLNFDKFRGCIYSKSNWINLKLYFFSHNHVPVKNCVNLLVVTLTFQSLSNIAMFCHFPLNHRLFGKRVAIHLQKIHESNLKMDELEHMMFPFPKGKEPPYSLRFHVVNNFWVPTFNTKNHIHVVVVAPVKTGLCSSFGLTFKKGHHRSIFLRCKFPIC